MADDDDRDGRRAALLAALLTGKGEVPTGTLGRLRRTAGAALRGAVSLRGDDLDPKALARLLRSVGELKGVAMKGAQLMSYVDVSLPAELRDALALLQTWSPPMPRAEVERLVREDLGAEAAEALVATLSAEPVAAASIGQVHRATLPDGTGVAVKVRYPGIEDAIRSDFRPAAGGVKLASLLYGGAGIEGMVAEAKDRLLEECDYRHEAAMQRRFVELFDGDPVITVPAVHDAFCGHRVLTTTFVEGWGFEAWVDGDPPQAHRDRLGVALFDFYVGTLFRHGLYNCDPHPGNYLILEGPRLAMLDYGCTRAFEGDLVPDLAALTRAVQDDDRAALERACEKLGMLPKRKRAAALDLARRLFRAYLGPMLEDRVQPVDLGAAMTLSELARGKQQLLRLALPREMLFLLRIRFGLMSVLARLGARANWYRLERAASEAALPAGLTG